MEQQNWTSGIYIPAGCEKVLMLTYCRTTRHPVQQGSLRSKQEEWKKTLLYESLQSSLTQDPCELS